MKNFRLFSAKEKRIEICKKSEFFLIENTLEASNEIYFVNILKNEMILRKYENSTSDNSKTIFCSLKELEGLFCLF